jgi:hypothetical protein
LAIKHMRTNCNTGIKCHRRGWPNYRKIKCHIVTLALIFGLNVQCLLSLSSSACPVLCVLVWLFYHFSPAQAVLS